MSQNDYIYYNLNLINDKTQQSTFSNDPPSSFYERTNGIIIEDTSLWKVAIAKADFRGRFDIPKFIPRIVENQVNQTVYVISISLNISCTISGNTRNTKLNSSKPILYIPFDKSIQQPSQYKYKQQDDPYYYVYDFEHLSLMINNTFTTIMEDLNSQFKAWYATYDSTATVSLSTETPVCEYKNDVFSIYFDNTGWGSNSTSSLPQKEQYELFFDTNFWGILNNFPHLLHKDEQYKLGNEYKYNYVQILINEGFDSTVTHNSKTFIKVSQSQPSSEYIMPASSLQFTTSNIPVYPEVEGGELTVQNDNIISERSTNIDYVDVLTEISLFGSIDGILVYDPTHQRFLSMRDGRISDVQISVWWKNRFTGSRLPLQMGNGAQINIKILFQRKYI